MGYGFLLDALMAAGFAILAPPPDTPESRQHVLLPPLVPPDAGILLSGALLHAKGGLDSEAAAEHTARRMAVVSLGTTLLGLARVYLTAFNAVCVPALSDLELARALLRYNKDSLGYAGVAGAAPALPNWQVGFLLTLPIELNAAKGVTDQAKMAAWAAVVAAEDVAAIDAALKEPVRALPIPSADEFQNPVRALLGAAPAPKVDALVGAVKKMLLVNPYEAVFFAVELMRQLRFGPAPYAAIGRARPTPSKSPKQETTYHARTAPSGRATKGKG